MYLKYIEALIILMLFAGCTKDLTPEQKKYFGTIEKFRKEKNDYMKNDKGSPFSQDSNAVFSDLKYYEINPSFVFRSRLFEFPQKDTISVFGTKGDERKNIKFGYVIINYAGKEYRINVYKGKSRIGEEYYSIWFTDRTTGNETYGVGRYIDFDYVADSNHIYTIDFNLAYNPYCAYSSRYSCAIPTKEDHVDISIEAGEKSFH